MVRLGQAVITMEVFLGVLMGFLAGMMLCAKYLRQEITAKIGPRLEHIEVQLENLQSEVNLDAATRFAALSELLETRNLRGWRGNQAAGPDGNE